ncbi:MAG: hypothetical protein JXM70_15255, partial [Pirellulales bacterium]|nr:hypothetical protein [Pirellulales bacterium]
SHMVLKIRLSEPITAAIWDIGGHGRNVAPPAALTARYSRDGREWHDAHKYAAGGGNYDPPPVKLKFDPPTQEIYIGWFADVPSGTGWWLVGDTGEFTFTPAGKPIDPGADKAQPSEAVQDDLYGPRTIPDTFFGTTTHVNNEDMAGLLKDLQVPCVRIDFPWAGLEPGPGQYNMDPNLWILKSADLGVKHALDQLVVLTTPPAWAVGEDGTYPNKKSEKALEDFMFQIASKYKGKIRHWQASNEPNIAIWRERFIAFLKAYHRGVKRADPQNKVVLCGFAGVEHEHLDAVYRLGGKPYFDILGAHSYTRPAMPESGYTMRLKAIRDVMRKYGDDKPVWVDEIGWNGVEPSMLSYLRSKFDYHRQYSGTEEEQARYLARVYLISATIPWVERVYFFHLHQEAAYTEVSANADHYMGLFTPWRDGQIRPKDAYFAVKQVIKVLRGSAFKERIETPTRIWALHFERGDEAIVALWSLDDGNAMILGDTSMITAVESMVGTPVLVEKGLLPLGGRPIYLKAALKDVEKLKEQIRKAGTKTVNAPGNSMQQNSGSKSVWKANIQK